MRRFVTFVAVSLGTALAALWWLHEGDADAVTAAVRGAVTWAAGERA